MLHRATSSPLYFHNWRNDILRSENCQRRSGWQWAVGGGVRAAILRRIVDTQGVAYVADIPTNDRPIGLKDHDSLNFRPIARALELFDPPPSTMRGGL